MATCQPGEIVQISNSAETLDKAIDQTTINAGRIVDHENRLLVNESAISQNVQDIAALNDSVQFANVNGDPTEVFQAKDPVALQEVVTLNYLTNVSLGDAESLGGVSSTGYALIGGSSTQVFKVGNDVSTDSAVSGQRMIDYTAKKNGDGLNVFQVADPLAAQDAVPKAWADAKYEISGTSYTKAESDTKYALITNTYLKSEIYTKTETDLAISNAILTHKADASAHHVKT